MNRNYGFRVEDVTFLLEGNSQAKHALFWKEQEPVAKKGTVPLPRYETSEFLQG